MGKRFYKNAAEPLSEVLEGSRFNQYGVENLCEAVLRYSYNDLLDAMFAATAIANKDESYNCHIYYEYLRTGKGRFSPTRRGKEIAEGKVQEIEYWFKSWKCKIFCKAVDGEYFVSQARKQIERWQSDEIPEWEARPTYDVQDYRTNVKREKRDINKWKEARDKWRQERGL